MLMSHEKIVSISFLIKIIFLIIFIVFTIYLFYMENKIMEYNNKELENIGYTLFYANYSRYLHLFKRILLIEIKIVEVE